MKTLIIKNTGVTILIFNKIGSRTGNTTSNIER